MQLGGRSGLELEVVGLAHGNHLARRPQGSLEGDGGQARRTPLQRIRNVVRPGAPKGSFSPKRSAPGERISASAPAGVDMCGRAA